MNVLIVFAHPEPHSFNAALKATTVETLSSIGHRVVISDLYQMGWAAALSAADFSSRENPRYLDVSREQEHAFRVGGTAPDVREEQVKVSEADMVIFHFPIWWFSMPAILKGWIDRVFSRGFAYSAGRKYESGHFKGKQAFLCVTTGTPATTYEPNGIDGDLLHVLWPIHNGILAYTGFSVLPPFAAWMPARVNAEEREKYLTDYRARLLTLERAVPLFFHPAADYDESQRLRPDIVPQSGVQWQPKVDGSQRDLLASQGD